MRPSILVILTVSSYAAALAILDSAPVGRDVAGVLEAKSLAVVDDFESTDSADNLNAIGSFLSLMHTLDDLHAVEENPGNAASEDTSDDEPSTESTDDLEDFPTADLNETANSDPAGVADTEDIVEGTTSDSSPVIDDDYSLEDDAAAAPADVDDSNLASDDSLDRAFYNPEATKTLAFSGVDSFTLPLKLLNGTIAEGCTTLCEAVITPVSACVTSSSNAAEAEQAKCLCTDSTIGSLDKCLGCVINAVDLSNDTLSSLQQGVDDIAAQCSEAGYPVSPISLSNGTQPSNSTGIPSNTTTAPSSTTSNGTRTPAPTGTTPVTIPTSGAISQVKVGAGMTMALLGALVGTFF